MPPGRAGSLFCTSGGKLCDLLCFAAGVRHPAPYASGTARPGIGMRAFGAAPPGAQGLARLALPRSRRARDRSLIFLVVVVRLCSGHIRLSLCSPLALRARSIRSCALRNSLNSHALSGRARRRYGGEKTNKKSFFPWQDYITNSHPVKGKASKPLTGWESVMMYNCGKKCPTCHPKKCYNMKYKVSSFI